jgi:hypothetical protein
MTFAPTDLERSTATFEFNSIDPTRPAAIISVRTTLRRPRARTCAWSVARAVARRGGAREHRGMAADSKWQSMSKARRAAVYRAIGRAAREAREAGDSALEADVRIVMNVLRAHAKKPKRRATKKRR